MSELFPTKTIALEYVDCTDQSREYEFNRWYNKIHIPDLMQTPGILNVYRYWNTGIVNAIGHPDINKEKKTRARYLTLYRINSDDPWGLMQKVTQEDNKKRAKQGRMIDCIQTLQVTVWDFLVFRRTVSPLQRPETHLPDGMPEAMLVVPTICTDPARHEEFYDWYLYTHFHDLLETPGLVQSHRYRSLNPKPKEDDAQYLALYELASDDPVAVARRILDGDENVRGPQGRMINCITAAYGFELYQHIDL